MVSVEPDLIMSSEALPFSTENSVSFSRFKPPYWMGISSAGIYLLKWKPFILHLSIIYIARE